MKKNIRGISLIILIIIIVLMIILSGAIISNISNLDMINDVNKAAIKQDFTTFQEELDLYANDMYLQTKSRFNINKLNANSTTNPSIYEIIPSLQKTVYKDNVTIVNGKISLTGLDEYTKTLATEVLEDIGNDIVKNQN